MVIATEDAAELDLTEGLPNAPVPGPDAAERNAGERNTGERYRVVVHQ